MKYTYKHFTGTKEWVDHMGLLVTLWQCAHTLVASDQNGQLRQLINIGTLNTWILQLLCTLEFGNNYCAAT